MTEPHPIQRARERYGIELDGRDLGIIKTLCTPAHLIRREQHGACIYLIRYRDEIMVAVFCHATHMIKTFLPVAAVTSDRSHRRRTAHTKKRIKQHGRRRQRR